jgi:hypothetical protein
MDLLIASRCKIGESGVRILMAVSDNNKQGEAIRQILGYLNFSSGAFDPGFLSNLNYLFDIVDPHENQSPSVEDVAACLLAELKGLSGEDAFRDSHQAKKVLDIVFGRVLDAYCEAHKNLIFSNCDRTFLFNSLFVGRVFEATLAEVHQESDAQIVSHALHRLNDYVGHRPVAVLENRQMKPYDKEWIRPIPIYIRGVGPATGPYAEIVSIAIEILEKTDSAISQMAQFDLTKLQELSVDPRPFDFDHPATKRPNHHFGQWDEHLVDNQGYYRRFVIHLVTLEALSGRVHQLDLPKKELEFEAGAVLAGTMLMASGVCGYGPGAIDSNTTLATLMPAIATYRDAFYEQLLEQVTIEHKARLLEEIKSRHQPFGSARQHLNTTLSAMRANQLIHLHLSKVFGQIGFIDAAEELLESVPVPSARLNSRIDRNLSRSYRQIQAHELAEALESVAEAYRILLEGIECGAIIDPWNILGFNAQYPLFQSSENVVHDHRADELVATVEQIMGTYSRIWCEAAAGNIIDICEQAQGAFAIVVQWWRKYAPHEVDAVDASDPQDLYESSTKVANALRIWHQNGAEKGDIRFWAEQAASFDSPKAYVQVLQALSEQGDQVTPMSLMISWLSQSEAIPIEQEDSSLNSWIRQWVSKLIRQDSTSGQAAQLESHDAAYDSRIKQWKRLTKFFDYLEANAEEHFSVPDFQLTPKKKRGILEDGEQHEEPEGDELYDAAYENMVYRDTTDDGFEGSIFDEGMRSEDELDFEYEQITERLEFIVTVTVVWRSGMYTLARMDRDHEQIDSQVECLDRWIKQAVQFQKGLDRLLAEIQEFALPSVTSHTDSLIDYDRQRLFKESLLDRVIQVSVDVANSMRWLRAFHRAISGKGSPSADSAGEKSFDCKLTNIFAAIVSRDERQVAAAYDQLDPDLAEKKLLYVPLAKGGEPLEIVECRTMQAVVCDLLECLPQLGLFRLTRELTEQVLVMERSQTVGTGAVTEFDDLFQAAYKSMVRTLIGAVQKFRESDPDETSSEIDTMLFGSLELLTESMLLLWLEHSQTLRLSVLEKVNKEERWQNLVKFITTYGAGLFTQNLLQLPNIRAILHQGVGRWLEQIAESEFADQWADLISSLDEKLPKSKATRHLTLVFEAVIENYNEYRDYNSTTTQSDHGEMVYMFLDFLRLRTQYDRVNWHLRPVIWGHELLVRNQENTVARMWRRSVNERVGDEALRYLEQLEKLQRKYSMQMSSVAERLEEKFIQPMQVDQIRALIKPAMQEPKNAAAENAFENLKSEAIRLLAHPTGPGVELPYWLAALEEEIESVEFERRRLTIGSYAELFSEQTVPIAHIRSELEQMPRRHA